MYPVSPSDGLASRLPLNIIFSDGTVGYQATRHEDLSRFLKAVREQRRLALSVKQIVLHEKLDGAEVSGVLEMAGEYDVKDIENKAENCVENEKSVGSDEISSSSEDEWDSVSISSPSTTTTSPTTSSTPSSETNITTTDPLKIPFENFKLVKWLSDIKDDGVPTQLYIDLLANLLQVCGNVEILLLPKAWYRIFDLKAFPRLTHVAYTEYM